MPSGEVCLVILDILCSLQCLSAVQKHRITDFIGRELSMKLAHIIYWKSVSDESRYRLFFHGFSFQPLRQSKQVILRGVLYPLLTSSHLLQLCIKNVFFLCLDPNNSCPNTQNSLRWDQHRFNSIRTFYWCWQSEWLVARGRGAPLYSCTSAWIVVLFFHSADRYHSQSGNWLTFCPTLCYLWWVGLCIHRDIHTLSWLTVIFQEKLQLWLDTFSVSR